MNSFIEQINSETQGFTDKEKSNFKIDATVRLYEKLTLENKQDWEVDFEELIQILLKKDVTEKQQLRSFRKKYSSLALEVKKKHGYTEKGSLQENAMGIGIALGIALGAGLLSINPAFIGVGIAIGVAVGLAIGASQEQEAKKNGKIF